MSDINSAYCHIQQRGGHRSGTSSASRLKPNPGLSGAPSSLGYNPVDMAESLYPILNPAVDPAIECASTLPSNYYVNPELLTVEKHQVFWRTWQIVGRSEQVRNSGDYITVDLLGEPLLVVRGSDGVLRGF